MKAAKESFPINVLIALILGIIIGYFIATYISGASGEAFYPGQCNLNETRCSGDNVQKCVTIRLRNVERTELIGWRDIEKCGKKGLTCENARCVSYKNETN